MHEGPAESSSQTTLHLHVGLPKTASTWLQRRIFPRLAHLEVFGLPHTQLFDTASDREVDHRTFSCAFRRAAAVWHERGDAIFEELLGPRAAWRARARDVLVSDEGIGRTGSRPELFAAHLQRLAETASGWGFDRVHVLCLVRRQDQWLASHYAQISDRNPNACQDDFAASLVRTVDPAGERYGFGMLLDYGRLLAEIRAVPARPELTVLPFEALSEAPGPFLRGLLATLGTPAAEVDALQAETAQDRANVRSAGGGWKLRPKPVGLAGLRRPLPLWADRARRRGIALTPDLTRRVLASYEAGNCALARETGLDLARYGYF